MTPDSQTFPENNRRLVPQMAVELLKSTPEAERHFTLEILITENLSLTFHRPNPHQ